MPLKVYLPSLKPASY